MCPFSNRNLLSEFCALEARVLECHELLEHHTTPPESEDRIHCHKSLQSLISSFVDLQQRYKQLREECARKVEVSMYSYMYLLH